MSEIAIDCLNQRISRAWRDRKARLDEAQYHHAEYESTLVKAEESLRVIEDLCSVVSRLGGTPFEPPTEDKSAQ